MSLRRAVDGVAPLISVWIIGFTLTAALGVSGCGPQVPIIDVAGYPAQMQADYHLFAERCSRCHGLARALNARIKVGRWAVYVRRMSRLPGAGLSLADQTRIAGFLEFHHDPAAGSATSTGATP